MSGIRVWVPTCWGAGIPVFLSPKSRVLCMWGFRRQEKTNNLSEYFNVIVRYQYRISNRQRILLGRIPGLRCAQGFLRPFKRLLQGHMKLVHARFLQDPHTVEMYDKKSYDKKSRLSIFDLWTLESSNFDLKIGFLGQNCVYNQLELRKFQTLAPKNAISYRTSPP